MTNAKYETLILVPKEFSLQAKNFKIMLTNTRILLIKLSNNL